MCIQAWIPSPPSSLMVYFRTPAFTLITLYPIRHLDGPLQVFIEMSTKAICTLLFPYEINSMGWNTKLLLLYSECTLLFTYLWAVLSSFNQHKNQARYDTQTLSMLAPTIDLVKGLASVKKKVMSHQLRWIEVYIMFPGCTALEVTPYGERRRWSSLLKRMLQSLARL